MKPAAESTAVGGEAWLLAAPAGARLDELARAFAEAPPACIFARDEADCRAAAATLAPALGATLAGTPFPHAPDAALATLRAALARGQAARVLVVLPVHELAPLVARALEFPPERAAALHHEAGRLTLLRDEPAGFVLRRANVLAPERESGTALPTGRTRAP